MFTANMISSGTLIFAAILCVFVAYGNTEDCDRPYLPFENNCYFLVVFSKSTWNNSELACMRQGSHLVSVTSQEEYDFILGLIRNSGQARGREVWIGLHNDNPASSSDMDTLRQGWKWSDGSPYSYSSWAANEPEPGEKFARIKDDEWVTSENHDEPHYYICEKPGLDDPDSREVQPTESSSTSTTQGPAPGEARDEEQSTTTTTTSTTQTTTTPTSTTQSTTPTSTTQTTTTPTLTTESPTTIAESSSTTIAESSSTTGLITPRIGSVDHPASNRIRDIGIILGCVLGVLLILIVTGIICILARSSEWCRNKEEDPYVEPLKTTQTGLPDEDVVGDMLAQKNKNVYIELEARQQRGHISLGDVSETPGGRLPHQDTPDKEAIYLSIRDKVKTRDLNPYYNT